MVGIRYHDAIIFTHQDVTTRALFGVRAVKIEELRSREAYSHFILKLLGPHIESSHALIIQWDGFVTDRGAWRPEFLTYDYIGATWPQFAPPKDVGNGGFSLRSKRLLDLCASPEFSFSHPEDIAIAHRNRAFLDERDIRFAPTDVADRFAHERTLVPERTFGFHGVFHMVNLLGIERFAEQYMEVRDILGLREMNDLLSEVQRDRSEAASRLSRKIRHDILRKFAQRPRNWRFIARNPQIWWPWAKI